MANENGDMLDAITRFIFMCVVITLISGVVAHFSVKMHCNRTHSDHLTKMELDEVLPEGE